MIHQIPPIKKCAAECLVPLDECSWSEEEVPLGQRGVRFSWLYDFVSRIWADTDSFITGIWKHYRSTQRASMYGPWDNIPWPEMPEYPEDLVETVRMTRDLVSNLIIPLTRPISAPLYARIPIEHRGRPSVFISHTWSSNAVASAHGSLDIVLDHYRDSFVWIDFVCYNQHLVKDGNIAADMKSIISGIDQIAFILTTQPFFTRSWCLWEIVCGYKTGVKVKVHDQITRIKKKYWSSEASQMPPNFKSITELSATKKSDEEKIFELLVSTFGSVSQADDYIRSILAKEL
ncbi:MAG: hypothetical protein KBB67_08510 [Syntrophorhabdus sp.]|jgi:hypothetical protein|nr:hypothetical protein [Syntrophorhabdus sp.]HQG26127.1 hypothetical protein [Syntrophorhabdus sp.]